MRILLFKILIDYGVFFLEIFRLRGGKPAELSIISCLIKSNFRNTKLVQNLDFAQTILAAAGIPAPSDMQGESMIPLLTGKGKWTRDAVYYHYYEYPAEHMVNRHYAIVTKDYKLIHYYFVEDKWELIDRKQDPMELKNVYDDPAYAKVKKELHIRLEQLRKKYKDKTELSQQYVEKFLEDATNGKVFGITKEEVQQIMERRKKIKWVLWVF